MLVVQLGDKLAEDAHLVVFALASLDGDLVEDAAHVSGHGYLPVMTSSPMANSAGSPALNVRGVVSAA